MRCWFLVIGCCIAALACFAQPGTSESGFVGFGRLPVKTPDSLLQQWGKAETLDEKFTAAQQLIHYHETAGTTDSVIFYARIVHDQASNENPKYSAATSLALARAYQEKGLYDEALRYYLAGIATGEELQDQTIVNRHKFGQATVYFLRKNYEKAISLYNELLKEAHEEDLLQQVNKQLGVIYLSQKELPKASAHLDKALHYFQQTDRLKDELEVRLNLGMLAEAEKRIDSAYSTYDQVRNTALDHDIFDLYIRAVQRMGDILTAEKDYENAKILLSTVYINAMQWQDLEAQQKVLRSLQELHAVTGDYKNAYALSSQYRKVSNEILEQQNKKEINELEVKYNTAQKETEILTKESQLQHQKTVKYGLLIGFLVVLGPIIGLLYMYYQKLQTQSSLHASREEASQQKITAMLKEKELELLVASMEGEEKERKRLAQELHDSIGGNLAAIKMQLSQQNAHNGTSQLINQLDDTYQQVRDLSHNLVPQKFSNTGFTTLINSYLQRFNVADKLRIAFQAYPEEEVNGLPTLVKVEVYKIIQELMTNANKHAAASAIDLQLTLVDQVLKLIFEDNGKGFSEDKTETGFGLRNIRERLKAHGGLLNIDSFPGRGTVVDIEIPINPATNEV